MNHPEALEAFFHPSERATTHFTFLGRATVQEAAQDSGGGINTSVANEAGLVVEPTGLTDID